MCSENQANFKTVCVANLKTMCVFSHRINDADISNVDEVFDAINAMASRSTGILNSIGNRASKIDGDLFWAINAVAMEIADIVALINAHYEVSDDKGAK